MWWDNGFIQCCFSRRVSMKLRVRIQRETSRVELSGDELSLKELRDLIRDTLLSSQGLSADTEFSLSLNGSEPLTDSGQTLSSCGIVTGDLICVVLPESVAAKSTKPNNPTKNTNATKNTNSTSADSANPTNTTTSSTETQSYTRKTTTMTSNQPSSSSLPAASSDSKVPDEVVSADPSSSSWEPMLCSEAEEGQAPLSLEILYESAQTKSPNDAIMVAGHQLMLETGFIPQVCELKSGEMPAGWRSAGGVYRLQYSHPLCENSLVSVLAVCMSPVLVINATLKVNESVDTIPKLTLNPCSYVTSLCPESAAAAFTDLKKLSRIFKDQLAYPLIAAARAAMSLPVAFGLAALPVELTLRVLRLLDVVSVVRLSSVCKHFNTATADSMLWKHLLRRDFKDSPLCRGRDTNWMELYKQSHKQRLTARRHHLRRPHAPHPWLPPPFHQPMPLPIPPGLPGIIGGEYDQRPNFLQGLFRTPPRFDPLARGPERLPQNVRPVGGRPAAVRRAFI
ncbi:F-box only protein 7-like isoform X2 [Notolabrus celidotus]|uniref:F-box only protein 7-like isoform X2 n=1 Tax=Notolabrus celidotus TaxID=1203425 RepID=UPI00148F9644|nr:F-box only protein 7-like isoform X2 [Notolabrus celidotus]